MKDAGGRLIVLFEGRDAAGKGGTIKRFMEHLNPRGARVVALAKLERMLVRADIHLVEFWFSVSRDEQPTRFAIRQIDPVRQWKLSPTDLASLDKWDDYTEAKEAMFFYTDTADAPWTMIKGNDKKRARVEAMRHVLHLFDYENKDTELVHAPDPLIVGPASRLFEDDRLPNGHFPQL
jgi:polyphosphate kinase